MSRFVIFFVDLHSISEELLTSLDPALLALSWISMLITARVHSVSSHRLCLINLRENSGIKAPVNCVMTLTLI